MKTLYIGTNKNKAYSLAQLVGELDVIQCPSITLGLYELFKNEDITLIIIDSDIINGGSVLDNFLNYLSTKRLNCHVLRLNGKGVDKILYSNDNTEADSDCVSVHLRPITKLLMLSKAS